MLASENLHKLAQFVQGVNCVMEIRYYVHRPQGHTTQEDRDSMNGQVKSSARQAVTVPARTGRLSSVVSLSLSDLTAYT